MRQDQINALVSRWITSELEAVENARTDEEGIPKDLPEGRADVWSDLLREAREELIDNRLGVVMQVADRVLRESGLTVEKGSLEYKRLYRELLKARLTVHEEEVRREAEEYKRPVEQGHGGSRL